MSIFGILGRLDTFVRLARLKNPNSKVTSSATFVASWNGVAVKTLNIKGSTLIVR